MGDWRKFLEDLRKLKDSNILISSLKVRIEEILKDKNKYIFETHDKYASDDFNGLCKRANEFKANAVICAKERDKQQTSKSNYEILTADTYWDSTTDKKRKKWRDDGLNLVDVKNDDERDEAIANFLRYTKNITIVVPYIIKEDSYIKAISLFVDSWINNSSGGSLQLEIYTSKKEKDLLKELKKKWSQKNVHIIINRKINLPPARAIGLGKRKRYVEPKHDIHSIGAKLLDEKYKKYAFIGIHFSADAREAVLNLSNKRAIH